MVGDFETIYREYGKTVYFFLLSQCRDESLANEQAAANWLRPQRVKKVSVIPREHSAANLYE